MGRSARSLSMRTIVVLFVAFALVLAAAADAPAATAAPASAAPAAGAEAAHEEGHECVFYFPARPSAACCVLDVDGVVSARATSF